MALSDTTSKLEQMLTDLIKDLSKVTKGNQSAAQRVRVGTIRLEKLGKQFRQESLGKKTKKKKR